MGLGGVGGGGGGGEGGGSGLDLQKSVERFHPQCHLLA